MLRLQFPSAAKVAGVALASLMLTLGTSVSYADNAEQLQLSPRVHVTTPHSARALYGATHSYSDPYDTASSAECIGGYRYIYRIIDRNLSPAQNAVPVRCR